MDFPVSMTEGPASPPPLSWLHGLVGLERPPLILTVLGGRTRAHLDNSSQASSPYLNCVGWQDKLTVEQLLCRWCLMLHFLAVTIWTPPQSDQFTILMLAVKYRLLMICTLYSYCSVIVAWSIESRKTTKWSQWGWGWFWVKPDSFLLWHCTLQ